MFVKRNGRYANGKQRWFCKSCGRSFEWRNDSAKHRREEEWFRRWLLEGYSVRQLSEQSGHSPAKLYRVLHYHLRQSPPEPLVPSGHHFILDGTFLHRPRSLIALMDAQTHCLVAGKYGVSESSERQLTAFFDWLIRQSFKPQSFTVDGNPTVTRVIHNLWPGVPVQRCLVHIQRQGLSWCRRYPKTAYARGLRRIFLRITEIRSHAEKEALLKRIQAWENRYGYQISHRPETGYVFSDIKRARSMLLRSLPDMFHYLDDAQIATSTNGLESYFSRLKQHYRQHRGLRETKRKNYFACTSALSSNSTQK